jgi:hypothetical protein
VSWALDRLCEIDGARWVYDNDELGVIRREMLLAREKRRTSAQCAYVKRRDARIDCHSARIRALASDAAGCYTSIFENR